MAVYVVTEGRIVVFDDATVCKISGNGMSIHIIRGETIIGSFPAKQVRYYGIELPACYKQDYENQLAWAALTPEERAKRKAEAQAARKATQ